eukprot:5656050-Amphidinium_carterae.1
MEVAHTHTHKYATRPPQEVLLAHPHGGRAECHRTELDFKIGRIGIPGHLQYLEAKEGPS